MASFGTAVYTRPAASRPAKAVDPEGLAASIDAFLMAHPQAVVMEEGGVLFHMAQARFKVETGNGRCVLQIWSEQRNVVRTVVGVEVRKDGLKLEVTRFGQSRPQSLRIVSDQDQRSALARDTARTKYVRVLERLLTRCFADWRQGDAYASADLEHSFGPAYVRTTLERGQTVWAVVATNAEETQTTVDGILTIALLWLESCRKRSGGKKLVEGVKVIVPAGMSGTTRGRMVWLNQAAKWELWELDELHEEFVEIPIEADGNVDVQLNSSFKQEGALERCASGIERVMGLLKAEYRDAVEVVPRSPMEISFRLHGLEFARVMHGLEEGSFTRVNRVSFGTGAHETPLDEDHEELFAWMVEKLFENRHPGGSVKNPLFRLQPERWLESRLRMSLAEVEPQILPEPVYTQVPAMAASDRGMLDLLGVTRGGRLAVIEIKAKEDLHLPMQGLDYWMRVRALDKAGEFTRNGYFPGVERVEGAPVLYFVVPSLRLHTEFETLLKYVSPEVEWRLIALDESWRRRLRVIFRKQGGSSISGLRN